MKVLECVATRWRDKGGATADNTPTLSRVSKICGGGEYSRLSLIQVFNAYTIIIRTGDDVLGVVWQIKLDYTYKTVNRK